MAILLAIAGISLTASAVSWWNGKRTAKVQKQIDSLGERLQKIYAADAVQKRKLIDQYVQEFNLLIDQEIEVRNGIETELTACKAKADDIIKKRFGSHESSSFIQIVLELELAKSRLNAERAYLAMLKKSLISIIDKDNPDIPGPALLQLPNDFPRDGCLVHFDGEIPLHLHGYKLKVEEFSDELEGRAMLFDVSHKKLFARISSTYAALLEANLLDGGGPIQAKVLRRDQDGIHLDYLGAALLLPCRGSQDYSWLTPETTVEVYPEIWTLKEIVQQTPKHPLRVRTNPRISGSKNYWSPILLSVHETLLPSLVKAYGWINDVNKDTHWRIFLMDTGQIAFSLGKITLVTTADSIQKAFSLDEVLFEDIDPQVSVRFHAGLTAFIPGSDDDANADRSLFNQFVEVIHAELSNQKHVLIQRKTAQKFRKLSLIYQDQQEYLQTAGSCGFLPGKIQHGGRIIIGTIVGSTFPAWVNFAISTENDTRLRITGREVFWDVSNASWIDHKLGICKLELNVPFGATYHDIKPFNLSRLELAGEGSQQQILSRALEYAILGKFTSSTVHSLIFGLSGEPVENNNLGRTSVKQLLESDEPVVAIWGPPGTGKTTMIVEWLTSLFMQGIGNSRPSVIITAPTHVAVNKLVQDLLYKLPWLSDDIVRYGNTENIAGSSLEPIWHRNLLKVLKREPGEEESTKDSWIRWKKLMGTREGRESATKWLLGSRHIHSATCVGMARRDYGLWNRSFDIAIIDEAGKAFGAELLIPASVARRVILVGDHNQLPPTVTSEALDEEIGYRLSLKEVEELLCRNMFHDLFEQLPVSNKGMLTKQYRMHEAIGNVVSDMFYNGHLKSHRRNSNWELTSKRMVFVDFSKVQAYRHSKSRTSESSENRAERAALHAFLNQLNAKKEKINSSILVVCPYKAQRIAVEEEVGNQRYNFEVNVTTVDAVQGGEADIVILLMTRSSGYVQFLLDKHRLNVALSRARDAVIVFGHLNCLAKENKGPIAKFVEIGLRNKTLDLIQLDFNADFYSDMAMKVIC